MRAALPLLALLVLPHALAGAPAHYYAWSRTCQFEPDPTRAIAPDHCSVTQLGNLALACGAVTCTVSVQGRAAGSSDLPTLEHLRVDASWPGEGTGASLCSKDSVGTSIECDFAWSLEFPADPDSCHTFLVSAEMTEMAKGFSAVANLWVHACRLTDGTPSLTFE